jgi:hypothetical protein
MRSEGIALLGWRPGLLGRYSKAGYFPPSASSSVVLDK